MVSRKGLENGKGKGLFKDDLELNLIEGTDGDGRLLGTNGDDEIFGGAGNDFIQGGGGSDITDGGEGIDTVSFADIGADDFVI